MTREEESKEMIRFIRQKTKEMSKSPAIARAYLIKMGILDKSGKRLAKRYR
jgi:hypothetical protein